MDVFKTKPGIPESLHILEETFTNATNKQAPYYTEGEHGRNARCFAVCPLCDNPIQIIGLYKAHDEGRKPYGRHYPKDILDLANYDEEAYYGCYYANPDRKKSVIKRKPETARSMAMYNLLREQFDRLIYILETSIEIKISYAFAEEILTQYLFNEGWLFYESTYANLPWMLIYAMQAKPLINRWILKGGMLYQFLQESCKAVKLTDIPDSKFAKVEAKNGFVDLSFYLCNHKIAKDGESIKETYKLVIVENDTVIFERVISVEQDFLAKLIALPPGRSRRNPKLQKIAEGLMKK